MNMSEIQSLGESPEIVLVGGSIKGAVKATGGASRDLWYVKRSAIKVIDQFNIRIPRKALQEHRRSLADSMKAEGFKPEHPLTGYVNSEAGELVIYLTGGHNRLAAYDTAVSEGATKLIDELPMILSSKGRSLEDLTADLATGNNHLPLEPLEKAYLSKRLNRFGWSNARIAQTLGIKTASYVEDMLLLAGAPPDVINMVVNEEVSAATAIEMLKAHGNAAPEKMHLGLARAKVQGKAKLTKRFTTDAGLKVVKQSAPSLFTTVQEISNDPAFDQLDANLREKIQGLMKQIAEQQAKLNSPKSAKAPKGKRQPGNTEDQNTNAPGEAGSTKAVGTMTKAKAVKSTKVTPFVSRPKKSAVGRSVQAV